MSMFENVRQQITADTRRVFIKVMNEEVRENYLSTRKSDPERTKKLVIEYLPDTVNAKIGLLLDTLANYLTDESLKYLEGKKSREVNEYYRFNKDTLEQLTKEFQTLVSRRDVVDFSSSDPRVAPAINSALIGGLGGTVVSTFIRNSIRYPLIVTLVIGAVTALGAYKFTYDSSTPLAFDYLEKETTLFLENVRESLENNFQQYISSYESRFKSFLESIS